MHKRLLLLRNKRHKPIQRIPTTNNIHNINHNNTNTNTPKIQTNKKRNKKMSQAQVLKILNKKKWQTAKDIHQKLKNKVALGSITTNLKKIRKYKLAQYKKIKKNRIPTYAYKQKW